MADRNAQTADVSMLPTIADGTRVSATDLCPACGRYHGGVNAKIACLTAALFRVRQELNQEMAAHLDTERLLRGELIQAREAYTALAHKTLKK